jgi:hypothetical protein
VLQRVSSGTALRRDPVHREPQPSKFTLTFTRANAAKAGIVIALLWVSFIAIGGVVMLWSHPYWLPQRYLARVEIAARPLIDAIEAHTRRAGSPPKTLEELLPEFDASQVASDYPPQRTFEYHVWREGDPRPDDHWVLVLYTELFSVDSDVIQYDSRTRAWSVVHVR